MGVHEHNTRIDELKSELIRLSKQPPSDYSIWQSRKLKKQRNPILKTVHTKANVEKASSNLHSSSVEKFPVLPTQSRSTQHTPQDASWSSQGVQCHIPIASEPVSVETNTSTAQIVDTETSPCPRQSQKCRAVQCSISEVTPPPPPPPPYLDRVIDTQNRVLERLRIDLADFEKKLRAKRENRKQLLSLNSNSNDGMFPPPKLTPKSRSRSFRLLPIEDGQIKGHRLL